MHIIADDLTGAADASVAFAGTAPVRLLLDLPLRRQAAPVGHVAIDVDCRDALLRRRRHGWLPRWIGCRPGPSFS
jgi:hypothetical protein